MNSSADNVFLIYDKNQTDESKIYYLRTFQIKSRNSTGQSSSENSDTVSFAIMDSIVYNFLTTFDELDEIVLIGNSAGGQFVNRYLGGTNLENQGKVRYVVSAPSHYLYFDENSSLNDFETPIASITLFPSLGPGGIYNSNFSSFILVSAVSRFS